MIRALEDEIRILINKYSRENISNTPDYILAEYLDNCLVAFEKAVNARTRHNNRNETVEVETVEIEAIEQKRIEYTKRDMFVYSENKIYAAIIQDKIFKYNHSKQVFERYEAFWAESYIWCLTNTVYEFADYKSYRDWCIEIMHNLGYFKQYNRLFSCKYSNSKNIYVIIKDDIVYRLFVKDNGYTFENQQTKNFNVFYISNKYGKSIDCIRKAEAAGYTVLEFQEKSDYGEFLRLFQ